MRCQGYLNRYFLSMAAMMAIINLQSRGITEDRILSINNFLEKNGYTNMKPNDRVGLL
jgi:hypothetical protein